MSTCCDGEGVNAARMAQTSTGTQHKREAHASPRRLRHSAPAYMRGQLVWESDLHLMVKLGRLQQRGAMGGGIEW